MAKYVNFNQALPIGEESIISRMQNAGSNLSSTTITIIAVVILFAILAAFYYFYYLAPQMNAQYKPISEHVGEGSDDSKTRNCYFSMRIGVPQVIEYDAKPSKDTLNQFLNTVL